MQNSLTDTLYPYIESHYPILSLITFEEAEADQVIRSLARDGRKIQEWNLARGLVDFESKVSLADYCGIEQALDTFLDQSLTNHFVVIRDVHLALSNNSIAIARLKALAQKICTDPETSATVFLVSSQSCVPPEIEKFITLFDLPLPSDTEIAQVITDFCSQYELPLEDGSLEKLALAFRGLGRYEILQLLNRGYQQDGEIGLEDVDLIQVEKEQIIRKSGILEMVKVAEKLQDIGGLTRLKSWLQQKAKVLEDLPAARSYGVEAPKGVMIVGMPGCGKSLTAKAASQLFDLPLLRLDMGSLMGKYVGESEANMRRALQLAEAVSPCVLWVDEVEKAFVGIGSGGGGSEVATRLFGYFLTWMQEKTKEVFVIATANDISALPPELLRKGRFDEIFYVDFPSEAERADIFRVHLKRRNKLTGDVDVTALAKKTEGYSGADIEAIIKEAIELAFVSKEKDITTARLLGVVSNTFPLSEVMKDKVKEYKDKFEKMKIKKAS